MSRSRVYPDGDSLCNTILFTQLAYNMLELNSRLVGSVQHLSLISVLSWNGFSIVSIIHQFRRLSKPSHRISEKKRVCAMNACIVCVPGIMQESVENKSEIEIRKIEKINTAQQQKASRYMVQVEKQPK